MTWVKTERVEVIPFTEERMRAAIESPQKLGEMLGLTLADGAPGPDLMEHLPFLADLVAQDPGLGNWIGLLVHNAERKVIGDIGFKSNGADESGMVEIGYYVAPAYRGRGYATEATKRLAAWALEQPGVTRVTAECLPDNAGSIRVLEKAGMERLGVEGDMLKWELRT